jgi:hypothetical protein
MMSITHAMTGSFSVVRGLLKQGPAAVGSASVATSTIQRAPPPAEDSRPEKDFSLQGRLQAALAPEATDPERDALLYAISRPLAPEASPREHADFLLSLLTDERSLALTGSNGRTLKKAATQALLALGYPYALEIPPEVVEQSSGDRSLRNRLRWGRALLVANAVGPSLFFTSLILRGGVRSDLAVIPIIFAVFGACTVLPMALILLGRKKKSMLLRILGSLGHVLSGLAVGGLSLALLEGVLRRPRFIEVLLVMGGLGFGALQLVGTSLLQAPRREE